MNIYCIYNVYNGISNEYTKVDNIAFKDIEKAKEYCLSKLTEKEKEYCLKAQARNLLYWYEYPSKSYNYYIKVVTLK